MTVARSPGEYAEVVREHERFMWGIVAGQAPARERIESARRFDESLAALVAVAEDATRQADEYDENLGRVQRHLQHVVADRDRLAKALRQIADAGHWTGWISDADGMAQIARAALSGGTAEGSTEETA